MPLTFPPSPTAGNTYTDGNSVVWQFDGTVWNVVTGSTKRLYEGVKVGFTVNYNLADTLSAVSWDLENFDTNNYWSVSDPSKLHIPRTGYYNLNTNIFAVDSGRTYDIRVRLNGTTDLVTGLLNAGQAADYNETQFFNAGDYIQLFANEEASTGALDSSSFVEITLLGYAVGTGITPYSAFSGARLVLDTTFSANSNSTPISWDSVSWDTNANALAETYWSAGTPSRITVKTNGFYLITTFIETDESGGEYAVSLRKNGNTTITTANISPNGTAFFNQTFNLNTNDYFEVLVSDTLSAGAITTKSTFEIIRQGT